MRSYQTTLTPIIFALLLFSIRALAQTSVELDKFTGAYKATSITIFHVRRDGSDLYVRFGSTQDEMGLLPQSANSFIDTMSGGQFSFSGEGPDMVLIASHGVTVFHAKRISEEAARALEDAVAARVKANVPSPGTEASARSYIASLENGIPNNDEMEPRVAEEERKVQANHLAVIHKLGALKSLTFEAVSSIGTDIYDAEFEHGRLDLGLAPLDPDGKVEFREFHVHN